jgi:hypothetical protein
VVTVNGEIDLTKDLTVIEFVTAIQDKLKGLQ